MMAVNTRGRMTTGSILSMVLLLGLFCLTNAVLSTTSEDGDDDRSAVQHRLRYLEYMETQLTAGGAYRELTVTPTMMCTAEQTVNTGSYSLLGFSMALSADGAAAVVGAPFDGSGAGSVYVYIKSNVVWIQQAKLTSGVSATQLGQFGYSVALSADATQLLVGEPNSNSDQGTVYYYNGSPLSGYILKQSLSGVGTVSSVTHFGISVAINSNLLAIGGMVNFQEDGSVWTYQRQGATWTATNRLTGSAQISSFFGWSLSISGNDTLFVGSPGESSSTGSTFAFRFDFTSTTWSQIGTRVTGAANSQFGYSVSTNTLGTVALIGGPLDTSGLGAAWVYNMVNNQMTLEQKFTGTGLSTTSGFGSAVALSGRDANLALIGAPLNNTFAGAALLFQRVGVSWIQQGAKVLTGTAPMQAGYSVAISANASEASVGQPLATTSQTTFLSCAFPTFSPTQSPSTSKPTASPSQSPSTSTPSMSPSKSPSTSAPTLSPTTSIPTQSPSTSNPTQSPSTSNPTSSPSKAPSTSHPSATPTSSPTTSIPTASPSKAPSTSKPSAAPTGSPTTSNPTKSPSKAPTTSQPTESPTMSPTTSSPTMSPSASPTRSPTTSLPTKTPSKSPTTTRPTSTPTGSPTTSKPTQSPSKAPTYARPNDPQCKSNPGMKEDQCNLLLGPCLIKHAPMKWVGTGCVIKGKRQLDGGCQCVGFCGYHCASVCNNDSECIWTKGACYHRLTNKLGGKCISS